MVDGVCQPCPEGTYHTYDESLGYSRCVSCPEHRVVNSAGTGCECDTANNWVAATSGTALSNSCCNTETSTFSAGTPNVCCPAGVAVFRWHRYANTSSYPWNGACCTADRKYARSASVTNSSYDASNAVTKNCRKCPNETDTMVDGQCKSCEAAYPGQNRVPSYSESLGYAQCVCPSQTWDTNGICKNCAQLYGEGYTYTQYGSGTHCCAPGHTPDSTQTNGCSRCPTGSTFSASCQVCLTDNQCTYRGSYFSETTCACACAGVAGESNIEYDTTRGCCYCSAKDTTRGGTADPLFSANGCYTGGY